MQKQRVIRALLVLIAAAAMLVGIYLLRPPCLILRATGLQCAGCGTQRMVTALLHGDLSGAWGYNPFMFLCLPLTGVYVLWEARRYVNRKPPLYKTRAVQTAFLALLFLAMVFIVLRNLQH